jgi:hypothetical protein
MVVKVSGQAGGNTKQMDKYWEMSTRESGCLFTVRTEYRYRGL